MGIFIGRDAVARAGVRQEPFRDKVRRCHDSQRVTMSPDKTAIDALRLMWEGGIRHVPMPHGRVNAAMQLC
jgi:hypothetical protein